MKKILLFLLLSVLVLTGCTTSGKTQDAINYNKERIKNTEQYLKENQIED